MNKDYSGKGIARSMDCYYIDGVTGLTDYKRGKYKVNFNKLFESYPKIESKEILLKQIEKYDLDDYVEINMDERLYQYKPGEPRKTVSAVKT